MTGCVILDISLSKECRYVKTNAATKNPTCTAILSFGIHNIHQRTAITEGGIIGLVLLINHWLGIPASVASPLLDAISYALAFKFLGWDFLLSAGIASISLAGFYRLWECFPPMLPDLTPWPLAAALLGGLFVGFVMWFGFLRKARTFLPI